MEKITILIIDDHVLVREAWAFILNTHPRFKVVGEAGCGEEGVTLAEKLRPNVVIMDINMPGMTGIDATRQVRKFSPATKILGVSLHTQPAYVQMMMKAGASGYMTKNSPREEMFNALQKIALGQKYICEEIKNILAEQIVDDEKPTGMNSLTQREIEIIRFITKGNSSKEIANELTLSVKTVEVHRFNILKKLNLKNAAALVNFVNSNSIMVATN